MRIKQNVFINNVNYLVTVSKTNISKGEKNG